MAVRILSAGSTLPCVLQYQHILPLLFKKMDHQQALDSRSHGRQPVEGFKIKKWHMQAGLSFFIAFCSPGTGQDARRYSSSMRASATYWRYVQYYVSWFNTYKVPITSCEQSYTTRVGSVWPVSKIHTPKRQLSRTGGTLYHVFIRYRSC